MDEGAKLSGSGVGIRVGSTLALLTSRWDPTMDDARLFRIPAGYAAAFRLQSNGCWLLVIDRFFDGEPWSIEDRSVYDDLSLAECADVLLGELSTIRL
jgi:hypothetical protein